jgi:thymidylate kinase
MFIAVDGIDGAGKTTLVHQLAILFAALDPPNEPLITKEPTKLSEWGRLLRESAKTGRLPREK